MSILNRSYSTAALTLNEKTWNELKDACLDDEFTAAANKASEDHRKLSRPLEGKELQAIKVCGTEIVELTPEEVDTYRPAGEALGRPWKPIWALRTSKDA